jgi:hypothetical protein
MGEMGEPANCRKSMAVMMNVDKGGKPDRKAEWEGPRIETAVTVGGPRTVVGVGVIAVMLRSNRLQYATITDSGTELVHPIRGIQFGLEHLGVQDRAAPVIWQYVDSDVFRA